MKVFGVEAVQIYKLLDDPLRTRIGENQLIEFRAEFFDVFNHANFGQPGRVAQVGSTSFGVITNTRFPTGDSGSSRQIQFALKYKF